MKAKAKNPKPRGLQIRPEQMKAFQPVADTNFIKRLVAQLRSGHADTVVVLPDSASSVKKLPDETLNKLVESGLARARKYGLTYESALAAFIVIMFEAAPNFDEHPIIRRILNDEKTPPNARIDQLLEDATEENWQAVKQSYQAAAWNPPPAEETEPQ